MQMQSSNLIKNSPAFNKTQSTVNDAYNMIINLEHNNTFRPRIKLMDIAHLEADVVAPFIIGSTKIKEN